MKTIKSKVLAAAGALAMSLAANAEIYVFGDSLSDTGNLQALDPSVPDRFTNGPVAVEVLAAQLGFTITNSFHLSGSVLGNNFAIAGAKAVDEDGNEATPDINLPTQVNAFLQSVGGVAPSGANDVYVVLIGGNDIRGARDTRAFGSIFGSKAYERYTAGQAAQEIDRAVASQIAQIEKLVAAGAQNLILVNAPDIGAIPETDAVTAGYLAQAFNNRGRKAVAKLPEIATDLSIFYNQLLDTRIDGVVNRTGANVTKVDLFSFLAGLIDNAAAFGLTNTDTSCISILSGGVNADCTDFPTATGFLFWDEIHPTTAAHQAAGAQMFSDYTAP